MRLTLKFVLAGLAALIAVRGYSFVLSRPAVELFEGTPTAQREQALGVERWIEANLSEDDFTTGSERFDGEWLFGTRMMATLGYAQVAQNDPTYREIGALNAGRCMEAIASPAARAFDSLAWGTDALNDVARGRPNDHAAYLGYLVLALTVARTVFGEHAYSDLADRIIDHLIERRESARFGLLETYPGEIYPVDNTAFFGALGLHDRVTGQNHSAFLQDFARVLTRYRDPDTGLLYQAVDPSTGEPADRPRGSGTALASYFVSFGDEALSRSLRIES